MRFFLVVLLSFTSAISSLLAGRLTEEQLRINRAYQDFNRRTAQNGGIVDDNCRTFLSNDRGIDIPNLADYQRLMIQCTYLRKRLGCNSPDPRVVENCELTSSSMFSSQRTEYRRAVQDHGAYAGVSDSAIQEAIGVAPEQRNCNAYFQEHSGHSSVDFSGFCRGIRDRLDQLGMLNGENKERAMLELLFNTEAKVENGELDSYFNFLTVKDPGFAREFRQMLDYKILSSLPENQRRACDINVRNGRVYYDVYEVNSENLLSLASGDRTENSSSAYLGNPSVSFPRENLSNARHREELIDGLRRSQQSGEDHCDYILGSAYYGGRGMECGALFDGKPALARDSNARAVENLSFNFGRTDTIIELDNNGSMTVDDAQAIHQQLVANGICRNDGQQLVQWCVASGPGGGGANPQVTVTAKVTSANPASYNPLNDNNGNAAYTRNLSFSGVSLPNKLIELCQRPSENCPQGLFLMPSSYLNRRVIASPDEGPIQYEPNTADHELVRNAASIDPESSANVILRGEELQRFCSRLVNEQSNSGQGQRSRRSGGQQVR